MIAFRALFFASVAAMIVCTGTDFGGSVARAAPAPKTLPSGFVRLQEVAPTIAQDMRYAGSFNFTGKQVPGYHANTCILARPVALALKRVQARLSSDGLSLKVYDCYRPERAVAAFMRWAKAPKANRKTKWFHPRIRKTQIVPQGYISPRSSHSRGVAVDLTLIRLPQGAAARPDAGKTLSAPAAGLKGPNTSGASCLDTGGSDAPRSANEVDMGTAWDCFDSASHTHSGAVSDEANTNRKTLLRAMRAEGFENYSKEWWHYSMHLPHYRKWHNFPIR